MPRPLCLLLAACSLHLVASDDPYLVQGRALPRVLDLAGADIGRLLPKDARDPAQVESARRAWEPLAAQSRGAGSLRLRLPRDERRLPLLLAASQALKAADPGLKLYLCFEAGAPGLWEETAWGALEGGILAPEDLEGTPEAWRTRLAQAQEQLPGRPWTLFLPRDPGASLGALLGDGGRLVVPEGGPAAALAAQLPAGLRDVEGGMGDLTLRARTAGEARRWTFQQGTWKPVPLPKERNEVAVTSKAIYDVGALLSRMRATQLRDRAALRSTEAEVKVDLHFQGERGGGDLGFTFRAFEAGGEPEELLRKEVRLNGVSARLHGDVPLPLVEARSAAATPVSLALTERYRYEDDGEAGPGLRRLKFRPVDKDPLLYSGTLVVEEATGRIREERTERSDLPGIVRSELRTLIYGEPAPGFWRVVSMTTHERWLGTGGVGQIQRTIRYADWKVNDPGFETAREAARASDGSILRQTVEGLRYFVKGKDGVRRIEERTRTSGRAVGGVLVVRPGQEPPVFPGVGVVLFDFDAFGKGIQYNLFSALGVVNFGSIGIPKAFLGLDFHARGMVNLLKATERPARDGQVLDREGVGRRTQNLEVGVGRDLGAGFRGELEGTFTLDQYSQGDDKYRTQGFKLPESGITRLANAQLSWQRRQFTLKGFYGVGQRPAGRWGMEGSQQVPDEGRFARWGGYAGYDLGLEGGLRGFTGLGWASGRGFDRFSPLDFNGRVSGIDDSAVSADRMVYGTVGCHVPTGPKLRLTAALEHGRARHMVDQKTYGFTGLRLAGDLPGFWWFTTVRLDIGAGLQSDIKGGKAVNGMVSVLRLF